MNYGFNETTKNWQENKKSELFYELKNLINVICFEDKIILSPYVEIDNLYSGVRIRRITHLSDKQRNKLVKDADRIYDKIMGA